MQQTNKYKLNLIESADAFLPAPLNENMQKVETALSDAEKQLGQRITNTESELNQRILKLEAHKLVTGYHQGSGAINLGFSPLAVFVYNSKTSSFAIRDHGGSHVSVRDYGLNVSTTLADCYYLAIV